MKLSSKAARLERSRPQSSELAGTITGDQIAQLELNGRDFTTLIKLVPGVSDQTGQDAGEVGPSGSVSYAVNGGRTEFNNWQIDGGEVLDSGSEFAKHQCVPTTSTHSPRSES